jgi:hypothetical protein
VSCTTIICNLHYFALIDAFSNETGQIGIWNTRRSNRCSSASFVDSLSVPRLFLMFGGSLRFMSPFMETVPDTTLTVGK